jgi:hypothetical protein
VTGQIEVNGQDDTHVQSDQRCTMSGGYADIFAGTQVVVTDGASRTIALGQLGDGSWNSVNGVCVFDFSVTGVPAGHLFYGIEVSHRGRLQYTAEQMTHPIAQTLGD